MIWRMQIEQRPITGEPMRLTITRGLRLIAAKSKLSSSAAAAASPMVFASFDLMFLSHIVGTKILSRNKSGFT